jgi:Right handed beta helix region
MRPRLCRPPGPAAVLVVCVVVGLGALALGKSLTGAPSSAAGTSPRPAGTDEAASSGSDSPPAACVGVPVRPGDDLQKASDSHPEGTTFCLTAGVHRLASVVPKRGQRFVGEGARSVLSGAKVLDPARATSDGAGHWYWSGQTQQDWRRGTLIPPGSAEPPNEGDLFSQELFVTTSGHVDDDPVRFRRVTTLSELQPGGWYLDQSAHRLYLAQDPRALGLIETSVTPTAIGAPAGTGSSDVTIENLVIEKYASPIQVAAVGGPGSRDWTIRWVTVRYNHGTGIEMGPGTLVEHSQIHHMGQEGLDGGGDAADRPTILHSSEVAYNRTLSIDPGWDAGGAKFTHAYRRGLVVENCWFHHNFGFGLWLDIDNDGVIIRSNRIEANDRSGIYFEVSRNAQIYWNEVFGQTNGPEEAIFDGAGIWIYNSEGVDLHDNLIHDNENGIFVLEDRQATRTGTFRDGVPHVDRVNIHDNDIQMIRGITGMRIEDGDSTGYWRGNHVVFSHNVYRLDPARDRFLGPGNTNYTFSQWQGLGNDRNSALRPVGTLGSLGDAATPFVMSDYGAQGD